MKDQSRRKITAVATPAFSGQKKLGIGVLSLGCPRNLVDSESILGRLSFKGYDVVDMDKAEVAIINTCAFIDDAKKESIDAILDLIELKKKGQLKKIIVYGCLSQRYKDALIKELPEIDAFVGRVSLNHSSKRFSLIPGHFAYLKICESCVNNCSYCIIPKIKGKFLSLDMETILNQAGEFDRDLVSELNIVGQDITGYGLDLYKTPQLVQLLKKIMKSCAHIGWVRLLYLHPERLSDELIELIRNEPKICKYIDLPIQHINDRILKLMGRKTAKKEILKLIDKIRKRIPQAAIRTSLIVGFPSEQDREFRELLDFIKEVKFERLGAFIYSREEGTRAFDLKNQLSQKIKIERFDAIMSSQQEISREINKRFLGETLDVLIDEKDKEVYLGRTQYDAPEVDGLVYVNSAEELRIGDFIKLEVTDTMEYDLVGQMIARKP